MQKTAGLVLAIMGSVGLYNPPHPLFYDHPELLLAAFEPYKDQLHLPMFAKMEFA